MEAARILYSGITLAVQWLGEKEPKTHSTDQIITIQRFYPSQLTFGPREEIITTDEDTIQHLKTQLAQRAGIGTFSLISNTIYIIYRLIY
jgi:hypothetical protein